MKNYKIIYFALFSLIIILNSCKDNLTEFFEDPQKNGVSIFSNKGFNLLTCYVNGVPWKTKDRIVTNFGGMYTEIEIDKLQTNTTKDTLIFTWLGTKDTLSNYKSLALRIAVDSSFSSKDFKGNFEGKRIVIDSSINGYFTTNLNTQFSNRDIPNVKGNGVILFQTASIDKSSSQNNANNIAGLLSAKIGNNNITDGRFDHALNIVSINF